MKTKMILSSIILSGGLLLAGQAIGQFQSQDQTLQRERTERSETGINTPEGPSGMEQRGPEMRQEETTDDQQPGIASGTDQRRRETQQQLDQQQSPQQQGMQQQFGVSPQFDDQSGVRSRQQQTQDRRDNQSQGFSDTTRDRGTSSPEGSSGMGGSGGIQSAPGSGGGGFGGQGGQGGQGGGGAR